MTAPAQQLPLPFDFANVTGKCPHCGHKAPLALFVPNKREAVLNHPAVQALSEDMRHFLIEAPDGFLNGVRVGVAVFEHSTTYTRSAAWKQLQKLRAAGLVAAEPKKTGGKYYQYRFTLATNGHS